MNQPTMTSDESVLLREAAEWHLIGLLFQCPDNEWQRQIAAVAAEVGDPLLKKAAQLAPQEATGGLYHTTFGPGGPASAREVSHRDAVQPGQFLAELRAFYEAFAYRPKLSEPPDHVSIEVGFIGYLRLKEAYAKSSGAIEEAAISADAAKVFVEDHIATIADPLAKAIEPSGLRYLSLAARALRQRTGPSPARNFGPGPDSPVVGNAPPTCPGSDLNV